jgi:uncharacterized protein (TIGR03437 family)
MKDTCASKLIRSVVLLVIAFLVFSGYALTPNRSTVSAQTANWTKLTTPTSEPLRSVHFLNENEGWAAGANATFLRTNGGANWSAANNSFATEVKDFRFVKFLNANVGWLGGSNGYARTTDGGASWVQMFFVAPSQINYQIPEATAAGSATITVINSNGSIAAQGTNVISNVAPGIFTANASGQGLPAGVVLRVRGDGSQVYEPLVQYDTSQNRFNAVPIDLGLASDQVFLVLYGTGWRNLPALRNAVSQIGGTSAETLYAGVAPGFTGTDQLTIRVPASLAGRGEVEVLFTAADIAVNSVRVNIK